MLSLKYEIRSSNEKLNILFKTSENNDGSQGDSLMYNTGHIDSELLIENLENLIGIEDEIAKE